MVSGTMLAGVRVPSDAFLLRLPGGQYGSAFFCRMWQKEAFFAFFGKERTENAVRRLRDTKKGKNYDSKE